ncbi:MAG: phospho-sugar mutase [Ruminococcaceae bacterium]|nr:phospho-sugar mutase [Oscillospiraceae bacterium]
MKEYSEIYREWLESPFCDDETKEELRSISNNENEIKERFAKEIEFGTAGLRGVLGAGTNRINKYIVKKATQGFADYIKQNGSEAIGAGIVIAHDNRRKSVEFALETAGVLAANGIKAYLFESLRPTPELSFAVRELKAFGGVMITASHNPPEYNGYKLYDCRGCQLIPKINQKVIDCISRIDDPLSIRSVTEKEAGELIVRVGKEIDEKYYNAVMSVSINRGLPKQDLKIVYSPQHGTGNIPVREVLSRLSYNVIPVEEQCAPDTEFSGTKNPNPETAEAYELAIEYAKRYDADLVITTDPDCDRLGVAVKRGNDFIRMTGNQSAAVLLEYILSQKKEKGALPENGVMFNTIVTSDLGDRICDSYGIEVEKTLTGFKFIGDKVYRHEQTDKKPFVFGYEESYGCLIGDFVRDKDAVQASLMLCESAAYYATLGKTLLDVLDELYEKHGYFLDALDNFVFKGLDGADKISALVNGFRNHPPKEVSGIKVSRLEDYTSQAMIDAGFEPSNVLRFIFEDGSWVAVRPSGTEPKCKFYYCIVAENKQAAEKKLSDIRDVFIKK